MEAIIEAANEKPRKQKRVAPTQSLVGGLWAPRIRIRQEEGTKVWK